MTEEQKDGMTEELYTGDKSAWRFELRIQLKEPDRPDFFLKARTRHTDTGPDMLRVIIAEPPGVDVWKKTPDALDNGSVEEGMFLVFPTRFSPGDVPGSFHCIIARELINLDMTGPAAEPGAFAALAKAMTERNAALGLADPVPTSSTPTVPTVHYNKVAGGFVPIHHLAERRPGGLPKYPGALQDFYKLRTPLNTAVGLALFSLTSEKAPGGWQEVRLADLTDRVFCLTERDAPSRGDHRTDVLAEIVKLHETKNFYVRYVFVPRGRFFERSLAIGSDYAIPNLELVYKDERGRLVRPSDPSLRALAVPLDVRGRRAFTPNGENILALPGGRFTLDRIRWRWNPSFVDDLEAAPALDSKGRVQRDKSGKVLLKGYNIRVYKEIFDALFRLRAERAIVAARLLWLLATDIYQPPEQCKEKDRNVIEREAGKLYDLLGLEKDPRAPGRREDMVAAAIFRLKQRDIEALQLGSDERPRNPSAAERKSGRRKSPYYVLRRSPAFAPPSKLISEEEAAELEAEAREIEEDQVEPDQPPKPSEGKGVQGVLPGLDIQPSEQIPTGAEIRAARTAAGLTLRRFAEVIAGPDFSTWSRYEIGKAVRIKPDVWQRVREFIAEHPVASADKKPDGKV